MVNLEKIYANTPLSDIPWNRTEMPELLDSLINKYCKLPCRTIDLGCGAGNYSVSLSLKGYTVTGVDSSISAIEYANRLALHKKVSCQFICSDLLALSPKIDGPYELAFDWLVLHHIYPQKRRAYIENVARLLQPDGVYLSVCFSDRSMSFGGKGKYRTTPIGTKLYFSSLQELTHLYASHFKVLEMGEDYLPANPQRHMVNYAVLIKK